MSKTLLVKFVHVILSGQNLSTTDWLTMAFAPNITSAIIVDTDGLEPVTIAALHAAIATVMAEASDMTPAPDAVQGWTPELALELDTRLRQRNRPVQADTIRAAALAGGHVDRSTVYELGGYDPERVLNGFTRPVNGVMKEMVAEGLLPVDAAHPMKPDYDPTNPSFQRAQGFGMAEDVAAVFAAAHTA